MEDASRDSAYTVSCGTHPYRELLNNSRSGAPFGVPDWGPYSAGFWVKPDAVFARGFWFWGLYDGIIQLKPYTLTRLGGFRYRGRCVDPSGDAFCFEKLQVRLLGLMSP